MYEVQMADTRPMQAGDLFKDSEGIIWVALNAVGTDGKPVDPTQASLVYHCVDSTATVDGSESADPVSIAILIPPFTLIAALGSVKM
jgi:hypothetical protein